VWVGFFLLEDLFQNLPKDQKTNRNGKESQQLLQRVFTEDYPIHLELQ